jgi:hypothetical protein
MKLRPLAFAALAAGLLTALPVPAHAASLAYGPNDLIVSPGIDTPLPGGRTRQINVDGQPVNITVTVNSVSVITEAGTPSYPTSIRVTLDSGDDRDLPQITAIRVKLERVKPPVRIYRSQLFPELTFAADPRHSGYSANITNFHPGVQLKATVTVTTAHETRIVNVGKLRVQPGWIFATPDLSE